MKPTNERPDHLLRDGEPVRCRFWAHGERGSLEECETNATEAIGEGEATRMRQWMDDHPRRIVGVMPGPLYLCDTHSRVMRECL